MICSILVLVVTVSFPMSPADCETLIPEIPRFEVDMTPEKYRDYILPAVEGFLPGLWPQEAKAFMLTVALQESDLTHRAQIVDWGKEWWEQPHMDYARSYYGFERIGVKEVFRHSRSQDLAENLVKSLDYPPDPELVWEYMAFDPILATGVARLALWRYPGRLPRKGEVDTAYSQYLEIWNPGKPNRKRFEERYRKAWEVVSGAAE